MANDFSPRHTWFGVGAKFGGQLIVGGLESTTGYVFNLENPAFNAPFTIENIRLGLGLGGGVGGCVLFVLNCRSVFTLHNTDVQDWGLNLAVGGKLDGLVKLLRRAKEFEQLWPVARQALRVVGQMRHGTVQMARTVPAAMRSIGLTADSLEKINSAATVVRNLTDAYNSQGKPFVLALDIPGVGYGLELSLVYTKGKITVM
jgi:hypothetical protein